MKEGDFTSAKDLIRRARLWPENLGVGRPYDPDERVEDLLEAACRSISGDRIAVHDALNRIAAYTRAHPDDWGIGALAGVVAMREAERREEAGELLIRWKAAQPESTIPRMVEEWLQSPNGESASDLPISEPVSAGNDLEARLAVEILEIAGHYF